MGQVSIKELLRFEGQWRSYQKRVLDRADNYLRDGKLHIVAAPGSGKTTLGIELIRRLDAPALILSPSINIRNQWLERIREAYLPPGTEEQGLLSNSLREPAMITAITYQALHRCMTGKPDGPDGEPDVSDGEPDDSDGKPGCSDGEPDCSDTPVAVRRTAGSKGPMDGGSFDVLKALKTAGVKTLCLDEAHHLRSEWWKALEELVGRGPGVTVISLTATPPYDASKGEWDRYIGLCGPIDEEITVPELVKEGSLCPHQDYVYFNMPAPEEQNAVEGFRQEAADAARAVFDDAEFASLVSSHEGLKDPEGYAEQLLEKPEFLSSMLIFLNAKGIPFSGKLLHMLGAKGRIPEIDLSWMEILLQGFLYEAPEGFGGAEEYRERTKTFLKAKGLIQRNRVCLTANEKLDKLLIMSRGKLNSICAVVEEEYRNLRGELRLLILTDYIKKEYMTALGDGTKPVNELGVVPIFETLRRKLAGEEGAGDELRMAALSGSVVLIPEAAKPALALLMAQRGVKGSITNCGVPGYYQVSVKGSEETASGLLTELMGRGQIRVLIGTKSLLGEGWDSPCINALILASFVGSFMLSNQMRGRAIRTVKNDPEKVSNIWHLVCMEPQTGVFGKRKPSGESEDFMTLKRRFAGFLGVHYESNVIESGLERLSYIKPPYTAQMLEEINGRMIALASDREALKKRWEDSLTVLKSMDVAVEAGTDKARCRPAMLIYGSAVKLLFFCAVLLLFTAGVLFPAAAAAGRGSAKVLFGAALLCELLLVLGTVCCGARLRKAAAPLKVLRSVGKGVLRALESAGCILSGRVAVEVDERAGGRCYISLRNGTEREKDVFAQCICELFGAVDNQRYLLKAKGRASGPCRYYCVPELFGRKKEDAQAFAGCISGSIGHYELIYTRSVQGRRELLEARVHSLANIGAQGADKRKRMKSMWR